MGAFEGAGLRGEPVVATWSSRRFGDFMVLTTLTVKHWTKSRDYCVLSSCSVSLGSKSLHLCKSSLVFNNIPNHYSCTILHIPGLMRRGRISTCRSREAITSRGTVAVMSKVLQPHPDLSRFSTARALTLPIPGGLPLPPPALEQLTRTHSAGFSAQDPVTEQLDPIATLHVLINLEALVVL